MSSTFRRSDMSKKNLSIPRWDLSKIYNSVDSKNYIKDINSYKNSLKSLKELINSPVSEQNFAQILISAIEKRNTTEQLYASFNSFAYCSYSTNTTNINYLNNLSYVENLGLLLKETRRLFQQFLTTNASLLTNFYTSYPQYESYRFLFTESIKYTLHTMSNCEEEIAENIQRFAGNAWSKLQEQIISNLIDKETGKTFNELRTEAYSNNRSIRITAYNKEIALLKDNQIPLAASLNNLKGATLALNEKRNWKDSLDKSCFTSRISRKTLSALLGSIEDSLPMWRSYMHLKATLLNQSQLDFYDLFAPLDSISNNKHFLSKHSDKKWTFQETKDYIIDRYTSFSKDMGNFAIKAFEENWIDAEIRPGKVGGAYDTPFPNHGVSRILSNFNGTFNDVLTLAHELGHAYHDYCVKDLPYTLSSYPMTLAETASIFAETIVMNDMISKTTGFEQARLIEMHLQDCNQVLVDILSRFYFEKSVFEERKKGELSAPDFCRLMKKAQENSYGDGLSEIKHPYIWALKSHYYISDFDFYNYPYAFGQLFSAALYSRYKKEGNSFSNTYIKILQNTGSMSCESVCKKAGFDIESKEFWATGISVFKNELDQLKKYVHSNNYAI